jgi:hypothetical protein
MLDLTALTKVRYVVDSEGKKAAVQVDMSLWAALLDYLEDLEDRSLVKEKLRRLQEGPQNSGALPWQDASHEW